MRNDRQNTKRHKLTSSRKMGLMNFIMRPDGVPLAEMRLGSGKSVADVLEGWNIPPAKFKDLFGQVVPYPFGHMIVHGQWSSSLVLSRFVHLSSLFPGEADWPPQLWLQNAKPVHRSAETE